MGWTSGAAHIRRSSSIFDANLQSNAGPLPYLAKGELYLGMGQQIIERKRKGENLPLNHMPRPFLHVMCLKPFTIYPETQARCDPRSKPHPDC
jgi:hypothetical protein